MCKRMISLLFLAFVTTLPLVKPSVASKTSETAEFHIEASHFQFEPNRIEVREGQRVRLVLHSLDGVHGFAIPEFGVSLRIPEGGVPVEIEFIADNAGVFPFGCSEYCGVGHADMTGEIVVLGASRADETSSTSELVEEADFNIINIPTTLQMGRHRFAFRVTHRFARPLGQGSFVQLLEDFLGLDGGAQIGLELRYGLFRNTQIGVYRTSDRTIQFFGRQRLLEQGTDGPIGLDLSLGIEGKDNFQEDYSPQLGVVLSRRLGSRFALYASPSFVGNTDLLSPDSSDEEDDYTVVLGLGARVLITDTVTIVAELSPRMAGFDGRLGDKSNKFHASFGVEKLLRGHVFQLNFSNEIGTTPAQIARGQQGPEDWFLGFNISRKF